MARPCVGVALAVLLLSVVTADAQPTVFSGQLTGHVGALAGGDVRGWTAAAGASLAVLDESGLGVELDASHGGDFDTSTFADSSISTVMLNFVAMYPHPTVRPFLTVGAGVMRVRVGFDDDTGRGQTDTAWHAGGGALYMFNEALGFRGDVRYFRNFSRQSAIPLGDNDVLDFVRASFGVTYSWPMR